VEVGLPGGYDDLAENKDKIAPTNPPATLNYDRWTGPAAEMPYRPATSHKNWRWNLNYGGGQLMDWVGHHVDIAHWGMGADETGPLEIEGRGEYPPPDAVWNSATRYRIEAKYAITLLIAGGYPEIAGGTKWIGSEGWIHVDRNTLTAEPASVLSSEIKAGEIQLPKSPGHYEEFIASVKSRKPTLTPASVAIRSATPGWLGQIAMLTNRKLHWDPKAMCIVNDDAASRLLSRDMRAPWRL
jgi:predicted dehydrogenase